MFLSSRLCLEGSSRTSLLWWLAERISSLYLSAASSCPFVLVLNCLLSLSLWCFPSWCNLFAVQPSFCYTKQAKFFWSSSVGQAPHSLSHPTSFSLHLFELEVFFRMGDQDCTRFTWALCTMVPILPPSLPETDASKLRIYLFTAASNWQFKGILRTTNTLSYRYMNIWISQKLTCPNPSN